MIQVLFLIFILKTSATPIQYANDKNLIIELNNDNFDEIISQNVYILVEFCKFLNDHSNQSFDCKA